MEIHRDIRHFAAFSLGRFAGYLELAGTGHLMAFIGVGWSNGGTGYGLKIAASDRDSYFSRDWQSVTLELPVDGGLVDVEVNIAKRSFWSGNCRELIHKEIGAWLKDRGLAPWPNGRPPRVNIWLVGLKRFRVSFLK